MSTLNENCIDTNDSNERCEDYVSVFDNIYTNNHIQILKALMPFMNTSNSYYLPVFIKYLEFQYTLNLINSTPKVSQNSEIKIAQSNYADAGSGNGIANINAIYKAINKYLAPNEAKSMSKVINTFNSVKNLKEIQQILDNINPESTSESKNELNSMLNLLGNTNSSSNTNLEDLFQLINIMNQKQGV